MLVSLLIAFSLVIIIEGLGPLLIPNKWRAYMLQLSQLPSEQIQRLGGALVLIGTISLFLILI
ncbi:DUF2065 domain-containing protein [Glaciecola sp. 1036]|uniref:DUF2065 domain-containing protein n=1 Tax=Alteromonadaceae TaxID=72275 RepID=UPI003CFBF414